MPSFSQTTDQGYNLNYVLLISSTGKQTDISYIVNELNVYEDIFHSTMSGYVVIDDTQNIIMNLPMLGYEFLDISFSKTGVQQTFERVFRVYKVDTNVVEKPIMAHQSYIIRFVSEEAIISTSKKFSKSYKGMKYSDVVNDILSNQLKVNRTINVDATKNIYDTIIPNWTPLEAIHWMRIRSEPSSGQGGGDYMFYESSQGYNYKSLSNLMVQSPTMQYVYIPQNINLSTIQAANYQTELNRIIDLRFTDMHDSYDSQLSGMMSSKLYTVDFVRQKIATVKFDYVADFNNRKHVDSSGGPFVNSYQDRFNTLPNQNYDSFVRAFYTTKGHDTDQTITQWQSGIHPNNVESWLLPQISRMQQLNYNRIKLVVPGDTRLAAGNIIAFDLPSVETAAQNSNQVTLNKYHGGNYLVMSIRHKMTIYSYEMVMDVTKDSVQTAYPGAATSNPDLTTIKSS